MNYLAEVEEMFGGETFKRVYEQYGEQLKTFPSSLKHHHCERGGYIRHVCEVMDLGLTLIPSFPTVFSVKEFDRFKKLAFVHDLDKLTRYELDPHLPTKKQLDYAKRLGIEITEFDSKSSLSSKIDNAVNKLDGPIQYYRYVDKLPVDDSARVVCMCMKLGIDLDDDDVHALSCHHGGWSDAGLSIMSPMATVLHCADLMSAKILGTVK